MLVSLTRLHLKDWYRLFSFQRISGACISQALDDTSCLGGATYAGPGLTFWTATLWKDEESLKRYVGSGAHRRSLAVLPKWCDEAAFGNIEAEKLPDKHEISDWLAKVAKYSLVRLPSANQEKEEIPHQEPWLQNKFK